MARYIAFLRAINVGGRVVKMERLRALFEELGFLQVKTFIASGNVIFDSPRRAVALELKIEQHLREALGYEVTTFLRADTDLARTSSHQAFPISETEMPGSSLYLGFLKTKPTAAAKEKLQQCTSAVDEFRFHEREIYWLCRTRSSESEFSGARLEKLLGQPVTIRNVNTVRRLAAKYPPGEHES